MIPDKIKQRILGLLGVCIILGAFVPVLLEEPNTFLTVSEALIPPAPSSAKPAELFASDVSSDLQLSAQIDRERIAYFSQLETLWASEVAEPAQTNGLGATTLPLSLLNSGLGDSLLDRAQTQLKETGLKPEGVDLANQDGQSVAEPAYALPRAWSVKLATSSNLNQLREQQQALLQLQMRSYLLPDANQEESVGLFVGPVLRREDAQDLLMRLQKLYPKTEPAVVVYLPEVFHSVAVKPEKGAN